MLNDTKYKHNTTRLNAGEVATLWAQYQSDTMVTCVFKYFLAKITDQDIARIVEYALKQAQDHISVIKDILAEDTYPIPIGFADNDVNLDAPRLFSDVFVALYLRQMSVLGMTAGALAVGACARSDASILFMDVIAGAVELHDRARQLLLAKGIYIRPPTISPPGKAEFISKQSFLTGFFGDKRPLTAIEVTHLFLNTQTNAMGKAMMMGFAQVASSSDVKDFMQRGKAISSKHMSLFGDTLTKEDLPAPMSWDANVTDSTTAPFSDKLMMFHTAAMISAGIGNYAAAAAVSQRRDIGIMYARLLPEIGLYAEEGLKIMIENHWMEEPPQVEDRNALVLRS